MTAGTGQSPNNSFINCSPVGSNLGAMTTRHRSHIGGLLVAAFALLVLLFAACGGGTSDADAVTARLPEEGEATSSEAASGVETSNEAAAPELPYATGPAVLIAAGYEPPTNRVDSTGAFLPANGKPTLVFVDAIW